MRIQHNIMAMNAYRNYTNNVSAMKKNLERLSSGYKINRAGDDAAGLAISEKMRAQITGLETAQKNAKDGISLVQTAEGALTEVHDMLNRMVELATQSANGTYDNTTDRAALEQELTELKAEINRISQATNFNGIDLLSGKFAAISTNAKGELLKDLNIDGVAASKAGTASATVKLGKNGNDSDDVDVDYKSIDYLPKDTTNTFDGVDPTPAKAEKVSFEVAAPAGTADTVVGGYTIDSSHKDIGDFIDAMEAAGWKATVEGSSGALTSGNFAGGEKVTLEAISAGATGITWTNGSGYIDNASNITVEQIGRAEGGAGDAVKESYKFTLDLTQLDDGQWFQLGATKFTIEGLETAGSGSLNIWGIDLTEKGNATTGDGTGNNIFDKLIHKDSGDGTIGLLEQKLSAVFGAAYDVKLGDYDDTTGKIEITLTAKNDPDNGGTTNSGAIEFGSNSGKKLLSGSVAHTLGEKAPTGGAGKVAQATYKDASLELAELNKLAEGSRIMINGVEFKIVGSTGSTDLSKNEIKAGTFDANTINDMLKKAFEGSGINASYTNSADSTGSAGDGYGQIVLKGTETKSGTLDALTADDLIQIGTPKAASDDDNGIEYKFGNTSIYVGDYDDGKGQANSVHNASKVSELLAAIKAMSGDLDKNFDITIKDADGKELDLEDAGDLAKTLEKGYEISFTAKRAGALKDTVMDAFDSITKDGNPAANAVNGWDEGQNSAGQKTRYTLDITVSKLAGGQSFSFGSADGTIYTFEFDLNSSGTDNGKVNDKDNNEVSGNPSTRDIITYDASKTDEEIAALIKSAVDNRMGDKFNVNVTVENGKISLDIVAKKAGEEYNLGQVRCESAAGSMRGTYTPYSEKNAGTPGKYAQVTWEFDPEKLAVGDRVKIGSTTVDITDDMFKDGKIDTSKLVQAFEAANGSNFTGRITIDATNKTLTVTGSTFGQTAENLANGDGYLTVTLASGRPATGNGLTLQIGDTAASYNQITVSIDATDTKSLGIDGISVANQSDAQNAIDAIKAAINKVSTIRGKLGATQNRLDHTINNLSVMTENIQDAESTIRDTDIAEEMMAYTKNNILIQASQAMLAQANQVPQGVLQLLQ